MYGMYEEKVVLLSKYYLIIAGVLAIIYYIFRRTNVVDKKADVLVMLSSSLFVVTALASYVYRHWTLKSIVTEAGMMKFIIIVLGLGAVYLIFVYVRAEHSYKKKRGNQRIKEQPKKGILEARRERKRKEESGEIIISLGTSADNQDP